MVGSSVGGYRILEKIRDGGAGTVFKAQGPKGEIVAIKMISEAWNEQRDRRNAFKREAEITQKLVHPGVIRVLSYFEGPPRPYIVLEYFPSDNLKFTLWHKQQVIEGRRMPILKQCAEALYYVHTQGIVHRDVKPENFLVNAEGNVRLIDFSISQTKWDRFRFSFGKKVDGTPLYMAPEQIQNKSVDHRADMYAFGVMVFELMTRRPPFIGASVNSILEKHLKSPPPSMRSITQDVAPELDELVGKLLSKKPADRPADMSFVIATLSRLSKKEEEARLRESRGTSRVVAMVGEAGATPSSATTAVPGTRSVGTRSTPGSVPAVVSTAGTKPPTSTSLAPAKPAGDAATTGDAPPAAGGAPAPPTAATTKTSIQVRVPLAQPVTQTQTRVRPGAVAPTGPATAPPGATPPVPPASSTPKPPPPSPAAPTETSPAAAPQASPAAMEASEAPSQPPPEPVKGNE